MTSSDRTITLPLKDFLEYALSTAEFITIPPDIGILIAALDEPEYLCHVEFPSEENKLLRPQLWNAKKWKESRIAFERSKAKAAEDRILIENYRTNVNTIARKLSTLTGLDTTDVLELAQTILKRNPESLDALNVQLVQPYYRGSYTILPFRERH